MTPNKSSLPSMSPCAAQQVFDTPNLAHRIFTSADYASLLNVMLVSKSCSQLIKRSPLIHAHRAWLHIDIDTAPGLPLQTSPTPPFTPILDFNPRAHRPRSPVFVFADFDARTLQLSYRAYRTPFGGAVKNATRITPTAEHRGEVWRLMPVAKGEGVQGRKLRLVLWYREKQREWEGEMEMPVTLGQVYDWLCARVDSLKSGVEEDDDADETVNGQGIEPVAVEE